MRKQLTMILTLFTILLLVGCNQSQTNKETVQDASQTEDDENSNDSDIEEDVDSDTKDEEGSDDLDSQDEEDSDDLDSQDKEDSDDLDSQDEEGSDDLDSQNEATDYIISDSDCIQISSFALASFTLDELRLARNEIYARHGLQFESDDLETYFSNKTWYTPSISNADDIALSYPEQINVKLIKEQESIRSTDTDLSASIYSTAAIAIQNGYFCLTVEEDTLTSYIPFTESWDFLITTEVLFEIASDCQWYICSPGAYSQDYSDAIESTESEVMALLMDEVEARTTAKDNGDPYDTSMSVILRIVNQKIQTVYQVSA